MAFSAFTSFMGNLFQDPAATYWGKKLSEDGEMPSPKMACLIAAIFNYYKQGDGTEVIHPHSFNSILQAFARPNFGPGAAKLPAQPINKLARKYYTIIGLKYTVDDSKASFRRPLLSAPSFSLWIMLQLCTAPEATLESLNTFLAQKNLIDPTTGEEFTYKCIPSECLPQVRTDMVEFQDGATEEWLEARTIIVNYWNEFSTPKVMENTESLQVKTELLKLDKENKSTTKTPSEPAKMKIRGNMAARAEKYLRDLEAAQSSAPPRRTTASSSSGAPSSTTGMQSKQGDDATALRDKETLKESEERLAFTRHHMAMQQQHMHQMRMNQMRMNQIRMNQMNNYAQMQAASAMQHSMAQQSNAILYGFATQLGAMVKGRILLMNLIEFWVWY
ncbi:uncharacterized protein BDZ99DRAFT_143334 [Mytilinidion resinicola]|uniref:DUF7514 domain-containing protein n=1 Tax=Mytilinidion resinicola TaxID=574789 RepID=A0A6A6Y8B9_9PEZI|nr:uncharacterized protein BDZ99DRAFT_143334 [Mytilinidion resinicola]KAF2804798.1 hypothetical protein BDZ99DRAFT_143334 [Mytilinidion resinicola]